MDPKDGQETEALDALLVLAFLEEPPPDPAAGLAAGPPEGDIDGPRIVPGNGLPRQNSASGRAA